MSLAPFFFAWVYEGQTTFDPATMNVVDENIYNFEIKHDEGQIPSLDLTIKNPRMGLLAPGRKVWAWLSYQPPSAAAVARINSMYGTSYTHPCIVPLFFGVLVGVPTSLFAELITLKFIARSHTYIEDKQAVAETMKVRPYYDPVWLDDRHRDDPDSILEGWSSLWHVDRTTLATTASDILVGEAGTITFTESDAFYDNVEFNLDQAPLSIVEVEATVNWTQRTIGYVDVSPPDFLSYTGQSLISDWPKPKASLGGGWSVESSEAHDNFGLELGATFNATGSATWHSEDAERHQCDVESSSISYSFPVVAGGAGFLSGTASMADGTNTDGISTGVSETGIWGWALTTDIIGICDPTAIPPMNRGSQVALTGTFLPLWSIRTALLLRYDANRKRSEKLFFSMAAETQAILTSPTVQQHTDLITISGQDVGEPLLDILAWTDFIGKSVPLGQIIYPNNPTTPGGLSYQICVGSGTAGSVEPVFKDIVGQTVTDNTVTWSSLGTQPLLSQPGWTSKSPVPVGEIINPPSYIPLSWQELVNPDFLTAVAQVSLAQLRAAETQLGHDLTTGQLSDMLTVGAQISRGQIIQTNNGGWAIATDGGTTGLVDPNVSSTYGVTTLDGFAAEAVTWTGIGHGSDGASFYICTQGGTTQYLTPPNYNTTAGSIITDGTVEWTSIGTAPALLGIPIGGTAQDVKANNYFPSDRGRWSVEHLICLARARLRLRSRAVKIAWDCPFDLAVGLSCRRNATIYEPRLPGAIATGKIISYSLKATGEGKLIGHVEIGCAVGFGNSVASITGTPKYTASSGYMQPDYQQYDGNVAVIANNDIGYTPPVYAPDDDGLTFPLTKAQAVSYEKVHNTLASQVAPLEAGLAVTLRSQLPGNTYFSSRGAINLSSLPYFSIYGIESAIKENAVWYELDLNPVVNGPFDAEYAIDVTPLTIPEGINLLAPSSP